jgi:glycolate oxidase FAD binding subunit
MATVETLQPADAQATASVLAQAAADRVTIVPHGNRTKLAFATGSERTAALSTALLTGGLAHYAGDLVATVPAGATLRDVNLALAREGQWIPIDPRYGDRATIGGIVATNDSGPRRHRFGAPRDLIIGIEVALTSGKVAHAGGRVVKNVAGYDLSRLFCGSFGSLGVITSATFKLAPLPRASRTVVAQFDTLAHVASAALALPQSSLTPSAIELLAPDPRLLVRFETTEQSADLMAATAAGRLSDAGAQVQTVAGAPELALWSEHASIESATEGISAVVSVLPTATADTLARLDRLARDHGVVCRLTGRVALGLVRAHATGSDDGLRAFARSAQQAAAQLGGRAAIPVGSDALVAGVDRWGTLGSAAAIGAAVKDRFDPSGVLPYPWSRA